MNVKSIVSIAVLFACVSAHAQQSNQLNLGEKMGIDQKLGAQVPLDVPFKDEHGKDVKFGDVLSGRPVLLLPMFYTCRGVCTLEFSGFLKSAIKMKGTTPIAEKFDVVVVSINPKETPEIALAKERELQEMYDRPASMRGWHLLTGSLTNIRRITDAVGFRYEYRPQDDLINHPAGSMILTPQGKVSSYIYGAEFPTRVLQDGFLLASRGEVGKKAEVILLGCVMVDPTTGKRTIIVENVLKLTGILTVLVLGLSILKMSVESKKAESQGGASTHA